MGGSSDIHVGGVNMTVTMMEHCVMVESSPKDRHKIEGIANRFNLEVKSSAYEAGIYVRFKHYEDIYKFMLELTYRYMSIIVE